MSVSIGVPTYNGAERLDYLLRSINRWTEELPPVAVLDDGSPPKAVRQIRQVCEKWKVYLIEHDENMGIAKSWNDLTRHFNSEIMILLNDDMLVAEDWLKTITYFLKNNKCGSASFPFYFIKKEDAPHILRGEKITPRDPIRKEPKPELENQIRENTHPGRIMCPAGSAFGFKREMFDLVGGFDDEHFKSFFEESDIGTQWAEKGYVSYGLTYPILFHVWSQTFHENPELDAGEVMRRSHRAYIRKWNVPEEYWRSPFDYTNPKFMSKIPRQKITWMGKHGKIYEDWDK